MAAQAFQLLMSPLDVGRHRVRNRIVFPAVVSNYSAHNQITDRTIDYYGERAKGGAGMIITEALVVHSSTVAQPSVISLHDDANAEGLKRLAGAVESEDCRLLGQLWHIGRQQLWNPVSAPVGVSAEPDAFSWTVPHVMDDGEIRTIIDAFVESARRLARAGFSGAELHGAHGYLIGQFLSPWSNTRDDAWGGDIERRTRFVREVISGIRQTLGDTFLLGLKMPGDEGVAGGIDVAEAGRIVTRLKAHGGLDYIAFSQGNFSLSLEDHVPDMHYAPGPFLDIHRALKSVAGDLPVMAVGRIRDAGEAEAALGSGAGDLIGMGRTLVADAALPNKISAGRSAEVRPCTFCNVCWGEIHAGKPMACIHNPELATAGEAAHVPTRAGKRKRVVVVGAGVAGLEAAATAAERGHEVVLFGSTAPGGAARLEASLPGRAETARVYEHQLARLARTDARLRLGITASPDDITALRPDTVILATGSRQRTPALQIAAHGEDLRTYLRRAESSRRSGTAVLFDQDQSAATYAAADLLAQRFDKLVLATPRVQLARGVPYVNVIGIYRRLYNAGVEILLASNLVSAPAGQVVVRNPFTRAEQTITGVSLLVWSTPRLADDALASGLRARGIHIALVGDVRSPRGMLAAIHEAHAVASGL